MDEVGLRLLDGTTAEVVALTAIAVGAVAQSATGMGFALVAAPALIIALGAHDGVSVTLLLAVLASFLPLTRDWRHTRGADAWRLLVPTLTLTPVFAVLFRRLPGNLLAEAAGVGVLVGVGLLASGLRSRRLAGFAGAIAAGATSAALNVVGGVGGPPVGLYAANAGWPPQQARSTLQSFFLVQNLLTVAVLGVVLPGWTAVGALVLGTAIGMALAQRLPVRAARAGVLLVSAAGGVALIVSSL